MHRYQTCIFLPRLPTIPMYSYVYLDCIIAKPQLVSFFHNCYIFQEVFFVKIYLMWRWRMAFFLPNSRILLSLPFSNPYGCFLHCLKVHSGPLFCLLTVRLTALCSALYGVTFRPLHFVLLLTCSLSTFAFLWYFAFLLL